MKRVRVLFIALLVITLVGTATSPAWLVKGHATLTEAATSRLPHSMPAFFRAGGKHMAHFSGDPDRWKNPKANFVRLATSADHYVDLEYMGGWDFPEDRYRAIGLAQELGREPYRLGMLPYAIMEYYERLQCAFHDHRQDPKDTSIHMKCLVYAGILSHFTCDTAMPLHTTKHYDGLRRPGKSTLQKGIHLKIDAYPENFDFRWEEVSRGLEAKYQDNAWKYVLERIRESHTHVETCYRLDRAGAIDRPTEESRKFIMDRCRAGTQFTMDLWYSAWVRSKSLPPHY